MTYKKYKKVHYFPFYEAFNKFSFNSHSLMEEAITGDDTV